MTQLVKLEGKKKGKMGYGKGNITFKIVPKRNVDPNVDPS